MSTTDKAQVSSSTTGTSTSASTTWSCPYTQPKAEQGWECPRCGRINAPWISHCDCSRSNIDIIWTHPYEYDWWKHVYCDSNTFRVHPETTTWKAPSSTCRSDSATVTKPDPNIVHTYVTGTNNIVGGSDYKVGNTYVNVGGTQSNKVDPNVTTQNTYYTNTIHN